MGNRNVESLLGDLERLETQFGWVELRVRNIQAEYARAIGDSLVAQQTRLELEAEFQRTSVDGERLQKEIQQIEASLQELQWPLEFERRGKEICLRNRGQMTLRSLSYLLNTLIVQGVSADLPIALEGWDCVGTCDGASLDNGVLLLTRGEET